MTASYPSTDGSRGGSCSFCCPPHVVSACPLSPPSRPARARPSRSPVPPRSSPGAPGARAAPPSSQAGGVDHRRGRQARPGPHGSRGVRGGPWGGRRLLLVVQPVLRARPREARAGRPPAASLPARHPSPTPTVRPPPRPLPGAPLRWGCGQGRDSGHSGPRGSGGPGVEVARSLPSSRAEWVSSQCPPRPWLPCDTEGRGAEADFQPHDRPELGQVGPAAPAGAECTARTAWLSVGRLSRSPGVVLQAALLRLLRGSQPSCHRLELDGGGTSHLESG